MPVTIFNQVTQLYDYILANIRTNGNGEITGQVHQDVLVSSVLSLFSILASVPPVSVNAFPAWDSGTTYSGESVVQHTGKLWLFVGSTPDLGTAPGTNSAVWQEISAIQLAHFQNSDQYLDKGGPYEVSAQQLFELLGMSFDPPTLAQVLAQGAGTGTGNELFIEHPFRESRPQINHTVAGTHLLNLTLGTGEDITVRANITLNSGGAQTIVREYLFTLQGATTTSTVAFQSGQFLKAEGLVLPTTIAPGERWHLHCRMAFQYIYIYAAAKAVSV